MDERSQSESVNDSAESFGVSTRLRGVIRPTSGVVTRGVTTRGVTSRGVTTRGVTSRRVTTRGVTSRGNPNTSSTLINCLG